MNDTIALQCMKPKLPSPIFRGDNNQTTAAIETIEHYGTYLFLLMFVVSDYIIVSGSDRDNL